MELFDIIAEYGPFGELQTLTLFSQLLRYVVEMGSSDVPLVPEDIVVRDGNVYIRDSEAPALTSHEASFGTEGADAPRKLESASSQVVRAPEELDESREKVPGSSTSWCLGILLFYMCAGYPPFASATRDCEFFREYEDSGVLSFPDTFSQNIVRLLCRMLHLNARMRITVGETHRLVNSWLDSQLGSAGSSQGPQRQPEGLGTPSSTSHLEAGSAKVPTAINEPLLVLREFYKQKEEQQAMGVQIGSAGIGATSSPYADMAASSPVPVINSPMAELSRQQALRPSGSRTGLASCASEARSGDAMPVDDRLVLRSPAISHLGWGGLRESPQDLYTALKDAFDTIGVSYYADSTFLSIESMPTHMSDRVGQAHVIIKAWVSSADGGSHAIGLKRMRGDTFQFHVFYRKLRAALAPLTGWTGGEHACTGSYSSHVSVGAGPPLNSKPLTTTTCTA